MNIHMGDSYNQNLKRSLSQNKSRLSSYKLKPNKNEELHFKNIIPNKQPKQIMIRTFSVSKNQFPSIEQQKQSDLKQKNQNQNRDEYGNLNYFSVTDSQGISDKQTNYETQNFNQTQNQFATKTFYHTVQKNFFNNNMKNRNNSSQSLRISQRNNQKSQIYNQSRTQQGFNTLLSPNNKFDSENLQKQQAQMLLSRNNSGYSNINLQSNQGMHQTNNLQVQKERRNTQQFYDTYFQPVFKGDNMGGVQSNLPEKYQQIPDIDYKTQFEFNNTQQNQHLYFLNFMHDQNNPPKHKKNVQIPNEEDIKQQYSLVISHKLEDYENPGSSLNFLNSGWEKDFKFIKEQIEYVERQKQEFIKEKSGMKDELDNIRKNYEQGLEQLQQEFREKIQKIPEKLKEDFILHQNEQFKLNREVIKLNKEKQQLITQIDQAFTKVQKMETQMFGFPIFQLKTEDPNLKNISSMNIRKDIEAYKKTKYPQLYD